MFIAFLLLAFIHVSLPTNVVDELAPSGIACNADYNAHCSRTNTKWLAEKVAADLQEAMQGNNTISTSQAWNVINNGGYNYEQNFFPFIMDRGSGIYVAHGAHDYYIDMSLADVFQACGCSFSDPTKVWQRFVAASNEGGDWVHYFYGANGVGVERVTYVTNLTNDFLVGVGYTNTPLPTSTPCSADYDSWCSIQNVQSLVGQAASLLVQAESSVQFEAALYELSYNEQYQVPGGFYAFVYGYDGTLASHARLHDQNGMSLADIFVQKHLGTYEEGQQVHQEFLRTAEGWDGGWVQYPWRNFPNEESFTKVAYLVKIEFGEKSYYLGVGFAFRSLAHKLPMGESNPSAESEIVSDPANDRDTCTDKYNLPCSFQLSRQLSSHAMTHALSSSMSLNDIWYAISSHPTFRSNDFYIYAYDFNGTLVAHGGNPDLVGMTMQEIYDRAGMEMSAAHVHSQFREAARDGGGWVMLDWHVPGILDTFLTRIAYLFPINIQQRRFYACVGFYHQRAPIKEFAEKGTRMNGDPIPCDSRFDLECSLANSQGLVGQAAAELISVSSELRVRATQGEQRFKTVNEVLTAITNRHPMFSINNFHVSAWWFDGAKCPGGHGGSGCCAAHGGDPSYVNKTLQEVLDIEDIVSVPGFIVHQELMQRASAGGAFEYSYSGRLGLAQTKHAIVAVVRHESGDMYVLSEYFGNPLPPTCDSCPDGMECTEPTQLYCKRVLKSVYTPKGVWVFGLVLMAVAIATALGASIWLLCFRQTPSVKASQPQFLHLLCIGAGLTASSIFFIVWDEGSGKGEGQLSFYCSLFLWFFVLGYQVMYMALFCKLWRLHRLLSQVQTLTINSALILFAIAVTCTIVLLAAWQIIGPLHWTREDRDAPGRCGTNENIFFVPLFCIIFLSVVLTGSFAWKLRRMKVLAESKWIFFGIFSHIQLWAVGTPIVIIISGISKTAATLAYSVGIFLFSTSLVVLVIGPKVYAWAMPDDCESESDSVDSKHQANLPFIEPSLESSTGDPAALPGSVGSELEAQVAAVRRLSENDQSDESSEIEAVSHEEGKQDGGEVSPMRSNEDEPPKKGLRRNRAPSRGQPRTSNAEHTPKKGLKRNKFRGSPLSRSRAAAIPGAAPSASSSNSKKGLGRLRILREERHNEFACSQQVASCAPPELRKGLVKGFPKQKYSTEGGARSDALEPELVVGPVNKDEEE